MDPDGHALDAISVRIFRITPSRRREPPTDARLTMPDAVLTNDDADTDPSGCLDELVLEAMQNDRHRSMILQFEAEISEFIADPSRVRFSYPSMSSYHRLILHRIAEWYRIDHPSQLAADGQREIILVKHSLSRIPRIGLRQLEVAFLEANPLELQADALGATNNDFPAVPVGKMRIMRRDSADLRSIRTNSSACNDQGNSDTSLQAREEAYAKARAKLFELDQNPADLFVPDVEHNEQMFDRPTQYDSIEPHEEELYRRNVYAGDDYLRGYDLGYPPSSVYSGDMDPRSQIRYQSQPVDMQSSNMHGRPFFMPQSSYQGHYSMSTSNHGTSPYNLGSPSRDMILRPPTSTTFPPSMSSNQAFHAGSAVVYGSQTSSSPGGHTQLANSQSLFTCVLEVYDFPVGAKNYQIDMMLDALKLRQCNLKWVADGRVLAVFQSADQAFLALQEVQADLFKLRPWTDTS